MEQDSPHGDRPGMLVKDQHFCRVYRPAVMDGVHGFRADGDDTLLVRGRLAQIAGAWASGDASW
jgi:hypothetical protein